MFELFAVFFSAYSLGLLLALLLLGAAVGFTAGLLGVGGGMLLVPFLTYLFTYLAFPAQHIVHMAIATSLSTILFTSVSSVLAHHKRGAVLWPVVRLLAPGIIIGSLIGAQVAGRMSTTTLALFFAIFVGFSATQMLLDKKPKPSRQLPRSWGMLGTGAGIGTLSSLVGAGGGFISVPFMTWCNISIHHAVATSAALGFPLALAGAVGYIVAGLSLTAMPAGTLGYINLPALFCIVITSVLFAPLGAHTAHALPVKKLKRVFAMLLYVLAAYMFYKGLRS
jgi:uncharacterized membrane protein YfcA